LAYFVFGKFYLLWCFMTSFFSVRLSLFKFLLFYGQFVHVCETSEFLVESGGETWETSAACAHGRLWEMQGGVAGSYLSHSQFLLAENIQWKINCVLHRTKMYPTSSSHILNSDDRPCSRLQASLLAGNPAFYTI